MKTVNVLAFYLIFCMAFSCKPRPSSCMRIKLTQAGQLEKIVGKSKDQIDSLFIQGNLNEWDMITLKCMPQLSYLDLGKASIQTNKLRPWAFANCHKLRTVRATAPKYRSKYVL